jgi:hypothetical protein
MVEDSDSDTFRFNPDEFHGDDGEEQGATPTAEDAPESEPKKPRGEERDFGTRGWVLVVMLFFAFGVIPMMIFFIPQAGGILSSLGLSYRDAFLVLPLLPALLLGAMAVWATTRP